jgi:hypothetical protein
MDGTIGVQVQGPPGGKGCIDLVFCLVPEGPQEIARVLVVDALGETARSARKEPQIRSQGSGLKCPPPEGFG